MVFGVFFFLTGLIGLVIFLTFRKISHDNIKSYSDFTKNVVGSNNVLIYTINNIMNIFLFISFIVMVSGFSAYFVQEFNIPSIFGALLICILSFITFFKSIDGIVKINTFLIPILILLMILLGFKENIFSIVLPNVMSSNCFSWIIKSILYASYNSIVLIPILISLQNLIYDNRQIKYIILITLLFMITLSTVIFIVLNLNFQEIGNIDIPIVYIANKFRIIL